MPCRGAALTAGCERAISTSVASAASAQHEITQPVPADDMGVAIALGGNMVC